MTTRLWGHAQAPSYSPGATYKGGWEDVTVTLTKAMGPALPDSRSPMPNATIAKAEVSASNVFDVCLLRMVSPPLAANVTIDGTIDIGQAWIESNLAADLLLRAHVWVSQGDSTTERGTLLSGFLGGEPTTGYVMRTTGAQAVTSVAAQTGDRIIVELGFRATNGVTTSYTGTFYQCASEDYPDRANGESFTPGAHNSTWVDISNTLTFKSDVRITQFYLEPAVQGIGDPSTRLSQMLAEVALIPIPPTRLSQMVVEVMIIPPSGGGMLNACDARLTLTDELGVAQDISGSSNYLEVDAETELGLARTFGSRFPIRTQSTKSGVLIIRALYTTASDEALDVLKRWFFDYPGTRALRVALPDDVTDPRDYYDFTVRLARLAVEYSADDAGPVIVEAELDTTSTFSTSRP